MRDITVVNSVFARAINHLQEGEARGLAEAYVGYGGTESPDHTPSGNPDTGGPGGVANHDDAAEEMYLSYISDLVDSATGQGYGSEDEVLDAIGELAGRLAKSGEIPEMPDPESDAVDDEAMAAWTAAAKQAGFGQRLHTFLSAGDSE